MSARSQLAVLIAVSGLAASAAWAQGAAQRCDACGTIQSIVPVTERQEWQPLGAVAPGSLGMGGLGGTTGTSTQMAFGPGMASQGLVVLGSAGGAVYAQRPNEYRRQRWDVTVKMDNGATRVVTLRYEPLFVQEGDRVRVAGNNVELVTP